MFDDKVVQITKFVAPEIIFGLGALGQIGDSVLRLGARKVFVVTDEGVHRSGWVDLAVDALKEVGIEYECFFDVTSNPKDTEVAKGVEKYKSSGCDAVLAVGGGSPIDVAKAVAAVVSNGGKINNYEGVNRISHPLPPMVVVPTTAGSGSEVSQFAMIVDSKRKVKMTIISKSLVPDIAVLDPIVLQSKDAELTAVTGLDALSHAIESYISLAATPLTDVHAIEALKSIANNLRSSVASKTNLKAKSAMAMASLQAGLAFSNAILGATHAMTHQVDGLLDLHHGKTNAVLLPHVMEFNMIACTEKFVHIAKAFGECVQGLSLWDAAEKAVVAVRRLTGDIGIPKNLTALGLTESCISPLVKSALNDACLITNPRDVSEEDLTAIFHKAL